MDPRVKKHAEIMVNWSTAVVEDEMVMIVAPPTAHELVVALAGEIAKKSASYLALMESDEVLRSYLEQADDRTLAVFPRHYESALESSDVVIWILAPASVSTLAGIPPEKIALRAKTREPLFDLHLSKRWCDTLHPCPALAQQADMSLEEYRDFVYNAILIDWSGLSEDMSALAKRLNRHGDIHLVGHGTSLHAETKGRVWMVEDGKHNMPSGEVYTSPVENSVEGEIYFDIPFLYQGRIIEGVKLWFEKGLVVDFEAERGEGTLKDILDTDAGSRRLGEIAVGMNRGISRYTRNMLFDEKMRDTIHCALGRGLAECNGTNESAVHLDMVKSMHDGEIVAGRETIYRAGKLLR
ncbi:aminopeptidase [Candidatus Thorarchaeota archaeon]|nr:MAG: aminopeptidase [Candidatus Thorarchaeota archaeon]